MHNLVGAGRFAPSPSGPLHLGNLRTALLAWLFARSSGREFLIRVEDLDRQRATTASAQLAELEAIGITSDIPPVFQHDRLSRYTEVFESLRARGMVYECFCTRAEIHAATRAPHDQRNSNLDPDSVHMPPGAYPGTCRELTEAQRVQKRKLRNPAWRLRVPCGTRRRVHDRLLGTYTGVVDDMVLRRTDGVYAYNLAVCVDDSDMGIDQAVRGDDLLSSTPRQAYLCEVCGLNTPEWVHVPLVLGPGGARLAKRDGAVTLEELQSAGVSPAKLLQILAASCYRHDLNYTDATNNLSVPEALAKIVESFAPERLLKSPWQIADVADLGALMR